MTVRSEIWKRLLGVKLTEDDYLYYEQLKQSVLDYDLLVDSLVFKVSILKILWSNAVIHLTCLGH